MDKCNLSTENNTADSAHMEMYGVFQAMCCWLNSYMLPIKSGTCKPLKMEADSKFQLHLNLHVTYTSAPLVQSCQPSCVVYKHTCICDSIAYTTWRFRKNPSCKIGHSFG